MRKENHTNRKLRTALTVLAMIFFALSFGQTPVAYYPFNGNANYATYGIANGTVNGATPAADWFGTANSAYSFDGVNDYIPLNFTNNYTAEFTVIVDVKVSTLPASGKHFEIISKRSYCAFTHIDFPFHTGISETGFFFVNLSKGDDFNYDAGISAPICLNQWQRFAVVYKASQYLSIYKDGILVATSPINFAISSNSQPWTVGRASQEHPTCLKDYSWTNGLVDEIKFYNTALTAGQVLTEFGQPNGAFTRTVAPPTITCAAPVTINTTPGLCTGTTTLVPPTVSDNCTGIGNALNFDGTNDHVFIPNSASLNFAGSFTLEAWIKPSNISNGNWPGIIDKLSNGNFDEYTLGIQNGKIYVETTTSTGNYYLETTSTVVVPNIWQHIAGVYNQSSGTLSIYLNGSFVQSLTGITGTRVTTTNNLSIGNLLWYAPANFNGSIDEVRIWSNARTQAQIQANMNNELNAQAGLVAAYHFNQGVAGGNNAGITTAIDASGNSNNGTLNNFALTGATSNWVGGNASSAPTVTNNAPATYPIGNTTVTWTATDANNNTATCTQLVTVVDNQPPTIICAAAVTINTTAGLCTGTTTLTPPTVSDNCNAPGNALNFDGNNDYINVNNANNFNLTATDDFTIQGLIKTTRNKATIFSKMTVGSPYGYQFWVWDGKLALEWGDGGISFIFSNTIVNDGLYHHVAAVVSRSTSNLKLYVDGVLEADVTNTRYTSVMNNSASVFIGQERSLNSTLRWEGDIDELAVFKSARTSSQILASTTNQLTGNEPNLVSYWKFNSGIAGGNNAGITTAIDASVNGNNGTLNNFALTGPTSNWVGGNASSAPTVTNNAPATYPIGNTTVTWTATDASNNTATCTQVVTVVAPEINVTGNAVSIADGDLTPDLADHTDFGQPLPAVSVTRTYTITNNGTAPLTISTITMSGPQAANFTVGGFTTPVTLAISGSTTFTVTFLASPVGIYNATVNINNTDCDENPYDFAVKGEIQCSPPSISTHPSGATKCTGESVTFSVTASGTGLTYQWRKGGSSISGATSSNYTISSVATSDAGSYDVVVSGTCTPAVTSDAAALTVNTPPSISSSPSNATKCTGESVTFSVTASGTGLTYQWRKNTINISGATSSSYTISSVATIDAGSYDVVVSGTCMPAATSTAATLTVNTPPAVSLGIDRYVFFGIPGFPGASGTITAETTGGTAPYTYNWSASTDLSVTVSTSQSVTPSGYNEAQSFNYIVTVTDANGCTATSLITTITYFNINCSNNNNTVKVRVCHIPQGNPTNCNSICVSINAYQTLLNNGSYLGYCLPNCEAPPLRGIPDISNYIVGKQTLDVKVFNNPSHTYFGLFVYGDFYQKVSLRVMDIYGRVIDQKNNLNTEQEIRIGDSYIAGVYMVEVMQGSNKKVVKLVKQ